MHSHSLELQIAIGAEGCKQKEAWPSLGAVKQVSAAHFELSEFIRDFADSDLVDLLYDMIKDTDALTLT